MHDYSYEMCNSAIMESSSHLFFTCPSWNPPNYPMQQTPIINYIKSLKRNIGLPFSLEIIMLVCWAIWVNRN
jgi:hypothetical protein